MADNVTLPGAAEVIAADEVTDATLGTVKVEFVKLMSGTLNSTEKIGGDAANGLDVDPTRLPAGEVHLGAVGGNATNVDVVPTISVVTAFSAGDYVGESGTAMTFAGCARVNAGTGIITGAVLVDYALQSTATELWLFDTAPTPPTCNAAWSISDAHAARCIGVIPLSAWYASALNSVAPAPAQSIPFKCAGGSTALYGCLVTRGAPTYANGDLTVRLFVNQD